MASKAVERRMAACQGLVEGLSRFSSEWSESDHALILERMRAAVPLGRTLRWNQACTQALALIEGEGWDPANAIVQGMVAMAFAIE